jgi:hypothetical protein
MGKKIRYIIVLLFLIQFTVRAQKQLDFPAIDSMTYKYYMNGNWDSLINLGKYALGNNIDFKYLRQRMGFAYFSGANYVEAQKQFAKALEYDSFDSFTLNYLYLSFLYEGNDDGASFIAGGMKKETRQNLSVKLFKPIESVEAEYNFKYAGTELRSNPQYFNIGITSRLGSRISLFQMFSDYTQTITIKYPMSEEYVTDTQPEYYALLNYSVSPYLKLKAAYHYLNTTWSLKSNSAHLGYIGLSADYNKFRLGGEFSLMKIENNPVAQAGLMAGLKGEGPFRLFATGELSLMTSGNVFAGLIYNQKAGLKLSQKLWLEGNVTFGNLSDFSEFSARYIYNTIDPTSFRCGSTMYLFPGKHISLWFNFSYERKDFYENINYHYNQFSYLGGIKWKI